MAKFIEVTLKIAEVRWNSCDSDNVAFVYHDDGKEYGTLPVYLRKSMSYREWLEMGRPLEIHDRILNPERNSRG